MLIEKLREMRCLIILNDLQKILKSKQLFGNYKPRIENYINLLEIID